MPGPTLNSTENLSTSTENLENAQTFFSLRGERAQAILLDRSYFILVVRGHIMMMKLNTVAESTDVEHNREKSFFSRPAKKRQSNDL